MEKRSILFLTRYDRKAASSRYRFIQYIPYLEKEGFSCVISPLFDESYFNKYLNFQRKKKFDLFKYLINRIIVLFTTHKFKLVVLEKELIPYAPALLERILNIVGIPYVVDYDDAIFHQYDCHPNPIVRAILRKKISVVMRNARLVIAGNPYLANYAQEAGAKQVEVIPTVIDITKYPQERIIKKHNIFTIVWIGSPSTYQHIEMILPILTKFSADHNSKVLLIGPGERKINEAGIKVQSWSETSEVVDLQAAHVGIMPLPDTPWTRGKCGFKLIQYMASSLPVIASPVGVNTTIVEHGKNGYLASTNDEWITYFKLLRKNLDKCKQIGLFGRNKVKHNYCIQVTAPRFIELLLQIINK
jgi:glycosyltransferase involved in cell wall biosynthesis